MTSVKVSLSNLSILLIVTAPIRSERTRKPSRQTIAILKLGDTLTLGSAKLTGVWTEQQVLTKLQGGRGHGFRLTDQGKELLPIVLG